MSEIFEVLMVVLFGVSWPVSIIKSIKARSSKGKSVIFLICISMGYVSGIISKFVSGSITYVVVFYIINLIMVITDIFVYFRNKRFSGSGMA